MQQRRLRLGDILDDYCPRERRVTNHAIVAMVDDDIKQTRCTTCDAEHQFKHGRMPTLRRKKEAVSTAFQEVLAAVTSEPSTAAPHVVAPPREEVSVVAAASEPGLPPEPVAPKVVEPAEVPGESEVAASGAGAGAEAHPADGGRVHRRLIRATLPRSENQPVARPIPEFTMHQPIGRGGKLRGGMSRAAGMRPVFGRSAGGRGGVGQAGRPAGRNDAQRQSRGHHAARHGKKPSK